MAGMSDFLEQATLDNHFNQAAYTVPTIAYLALFITDPLDDNSGTEVSGPGYARVAVTMASEMVRAGNVVSNSVVKTFPTASGSWGTVTHSALFDAVSAGNQLWNGVLTVAKAIESGEAPTFAIGAANYSIV